MAEGRSEALWNHTSAVMCLLANLNRDPKKTRPYSPRQFHPREVARKARRPRRTGRPFSVAQLADEIMALSGRNGRE